MTHIFIWNFVAGEVLDQLVDWFYGQIVGFLGNFFALMGNMGVELFELEWVEAILLFFSRLAWALFAVSVIVCAFECGIEYSAGKGNIQQTALNIIKGFLAVSLFTVAPVRLYALSVSLQSTFAAGLTGAGRSIGDVGRDIIAELSEVQTLADVLDRSHFGLGTLTSPIMLATAIGVKLSSPGPIIFKQERIGLNKKPFMMYKFRSMRVNVQQQTGWSTDYDPRKTHFGSFIRKCSLAELPQFFNVLKGDMSLVGPRPEVPYHVEHFKEEIPRYLVRQQVRPGCTGWAQIHGLRGDTDIAERIRYDIWYIENWTVALDIKIIFRTVFGGKMVNDEKLQ